MKIHIIDDNADLLHIYEQLFKAAGHEVLADSDGLSGITKSVDFQPDLVLLDIMMPEMDGFDFLRALHNNTSIHPMIIVFSNLSSQQDINQAFMLGADTYLKKSDFVGSQLVTAVEKAYNDYLSRPRKTS